MAAVEMPDLRRRLISEGLGTGLLLVTVVGSGIMAERLAGGNTAIALLGNTVATGAMLVVLITMLGPISGAHFNPVVTLLLLVKRRLTAKEATSYVMVQLLGAIAGVWLAHAMFGQDILQVSHKLRSGPSQWLSEGVATFGLIVTIFATDKARPAFVPSAVGLYITAAYWFTASSSFANPAVTIARSLSDTFSGIRPADVPPFILAQLLGAMVASGLISWLLKPKQANA
jgi:glycerol uptake facilitator-like aquaporin